MLELEYTTYDAVGNITQINDHTKLEYGYNRYRYTRNNPLKYTDPTGHCIPDFCPNMNWIETSVDYGRATGRERYYLAAKTIAALKDNPHVQSMDINTEGIRNDMDQVAMQEGIYASDVHASTALEAGATAGMAGGMMGTDRSVPGAKFTAKGQDDIPVDGSTSNIAPRRTGPKALDPDHHNANVLVRDVNGKVIRHERIVSGNMTPEEKALGFPLNTLASHTEARAVRNIPLKEGQMMIITGQKPPCPSCKGAMNRTARETGATIRYQWRKDGRTETWTANQ